MAWIYWFMIDHQLWFLVLSWALGILLVAILVRAVKLMTGRSKLPESLRTVFVVFVPFCPIVFYTVVIFIGSAISKLDLCSGQVTGVVLMTDSEDHKLRTLANIHGYPDGTVLSFLGVAPLQVGQTVQFKRLIIGERIQGLYPLD